jgi:hypothetical protein
MKKPTFEERGEAVGDVGRYKDKKDKKRLDRAFAIGIMRNTISYSGTAECQPIVMKNPTILFRRSKGHPKFLIFWGRALRASASVNSPPK